MNSAPTQRQTRALEAVGFFFGYGLVLLFGFLGDRPSRVSDPKTEGFFANAGQWSSAIFHAALALFLLANYGPVGLLSLALAALIWARRISAAQGIPYYWAALLNDTITILSRHQRLKNTALISMAAATVLSLMALLFNAPTGFLAFVAWTVCWGTWLYIASGAAEVNIVMADAEAKTITLLSKVFATPVAEWEASVIRREGDQITVTPPPIQAVLHYAGADAILALVAKELELSADSDQSCLMLVEASEETILRRDMEARTGGLIAGQIEPNQEAAPALASSAFAITADDL